MTTILIKKKDTAGAPAPGDLTNAAGGAEIAVNTATKRIYSKDSGGTVIEMGTYPSSMAVQGALSATGATNLNGNVTLGDASADNITVTGTITSSLLFTDATYDIGASGANRPRDLFLSRNLTVGGTLVVTGGINFNGNVTVGDSSADTLTINSTITSNLIFTDNTYDIGANGANRPKSIYLTSTVYAGASVWAGTTTFANNARNSQRVLAVNVANDYGGMAMTSYSGTTATLAPILDFNRSRGSADQSFTSVVNGDALGFINFRGASGAGFTDAAQIVTYAGGVVSSGVVPGLLQFSTSSTTLGLVTRYQISSTGVHTWTNSGSDTGGVALTLSGSGLGIVNALTVGTTSTFTGTATFNGGTTYFGNTSNNDLITTTSDGSDTSAIRINGGGAITVSRGAMLQAFGNENPSYPGHAYIDQGNVAGAMTYFRYGNISVGAQMDGNGYWKFSQAIGVNADPDPTKASVRSGSSAAAFRAQNAGSIRYRSDWAVGSSGITSFNSYDDTAGAYKPFRFDGTELTVTNGLGTTYAQLVPDGLRVSSNGSYSSLSAANLIYAGRAALSTNSSANVMRITDGSNADFNINLRSGASLSVTVGTAEMQTAAYNMWLSTQGSTGALKITDTVNNGNGGQVLKPFSACFSAALSSTGGQATTNATTDLVWATEAVDNGSNYNPSNGRFTAPVAGSYFFTTSVRWDNNNNANLYFGVVLSINGNQVTRSIGNIIYMPASQYSYSTTSVVVTLAAGDYVTAGVRQNSGSTFVTTPTECSFNGFLIG